MTTPTAFPNGLLTAAAQLPENPAFRTKVLVAVLFHARKTLLDERDGNLLRLAFARQVLQSPTNYLESFAWTMAADDQIAAQALRRVEDITDEMIFTRVGVTWDFLVRPLGNGPEA